MIREGLLDSERYWSVTIEAQRMFFHMLLLADDFGCISVSPTFLRRRCFSDSPTVERIAKLLTELIDVDLIRTYEVDRACLAFIPRFKQRLYRSTLKHAIPPESLYQDDEDAREKFSAINKDSKKTPVVPPEQHGNSTGTAPPEEKRREVEEKRTTTVVRSAKASSPVRLGEGQVIETIPLVGQATAEVCETYVQEMDRLFPAVDVPQTLREIRAWNLVNPSRRKTATGIAKHVASWLQKAQNGGR